MLIIKLEPDTDIVLFFSNIPLIVIVLPSAEWKIIHSRPKNTPYIFETAMRYADF